VGGLISSRIPGSFRHAERGPKWERRFFAELERVSKRKSPGGHSGVSISTDAAARRECKRASFGANGKGPLGDLTEFIESQAACAVRSSRPAILV
jgi:hypothetical protein